MGLRFEPEKLHLADLAVAVELVAQVRLRHLRRDVRGRGRVGVRG